MNECKYCIGTGEQRPLFLDSSLRMGTKSIVQITEEIDGSHWLDIDLWGDANVGAEFGINYCPMCGRKL